MSVFTCTSTICNFTLYWQFVPHCSSNIKITTTCNFRVNIFPSSPVLAGTVFGLELLSPVFTTIASIAGCQMNCFRKNLKKNSITCQKGTLCTINRKLPPPSGLVSSSRSLSQQDCHQSNQEKDVLYSHSVPNEHSDWQMGAIQLILSTTRFWFEIDTEMEMNNENRRTQRDVGRGRRAWIHKVIHIHSPFLSASREGKVLGLDTMEKKFPSSIPFPAMHLSPGKVLLLQSFLKSVIGNKYITFCPFPEILKLEQDKPATLFVQGEG